MTGGVIGQFGAAQREPHLPLVFMASEYCPVPQVAATLGTVA